MQCLSLPSSHGFGFSLVCIGQWLRLIPDGYLCQSATAGHSPHVQQPQPASALCQDGSRAHCRSLPDFTCSRALVDLQVAPAVGKSPPCLPSSKRVETGPGGHLLQWMLDMLDSLLRSLALLQLLSFCRIWAFAMPMRRRRPHCNRVVIAARRTLRGAPLCLAVAICLPFATAAPHMACPSAFPSELRSAAPDDSAFASPPGVLTAEGSHTDIARTAAATASVPCDSSHLGVSVPDPDSPVFSRVRTVGWRVPVVILQYQRLPLTVSLHTAAVRDRFNGVGI